MMVVVMIMVFFNPSFHKLCLFDGGEKICSDEKKWTEKNKSKSLFFTSLSLISLKEFDEKKTNLTTLVCETSEYKYCTNKSNQTLIHKSFLSFFLVTNE